MKTKIVCTVLLVMLAGSALANGNDDLTDYGRQISYFESVVNFLKFHFL